METENGDDVKNALSQRIIGSLVVAALMGLVLGFIAVRDTVRDHTIQLRSLVSDQGRGERFTALDGKRLERQININTGKLSDNRSREHDKINFLEDKYKHLDDAVNRAQTDINAHTLGSSGRIIRLKVIEKRLDKIDETR